MLNLLQLYPKLSPMFLADDHDLPQVLLVNSEIYLKFVSQDKIHLHVALCLHPPRTV
jgi:hypothetical protein